MTVEVTPAMIEAGKSAALHCDFREVFEPLDEGIRRIFQAMAAVSSPWRPISTAPKDGTRILACRDARFWSSAHIMIQWDKDIGRWTPWGFDVDFLGWMPLPAPPEAT